MLELRLLAASVVFRKTRDSLKAGNSRKLVIEWREQDQDKRERINL